jgi:hypothetical protein
MSSVILPLWSRYHGKGIWATENAVKWIDNWQNVYTSILRVHFLDYLLVVFTIDS